MAPTDDYKDRLSGKTIAKVTTGQIYWGAVPFVVIQIIMVALIIAVPGIVSRTVDKPAEVNLDQLQVAPKPDKDRGPDPFQASPKESAASGGAGGKDAAEDPMDAIRRANEEDKAKAGKQP